VALSGDGATVVVGAPSHSVSATGYGRVRVLRYDDVSGWAQLGADFYGENINDFLVIIRWRMYNSLIFKRLQGTSVSISDDGNIVAMGIRGDDTGGNNAGSVRIYAYHGGLWVKLGNSILGEAESDISVSVCATRATIMFFLRLLTLCKQRHLGSIGVVVKRRTQNRNWCRWQ
jgi:hypothetical protein